MKPQEIFTHNKNHKTEINKSPNAALKNRGQIKHVNSSDTEIIRQNIK